MNYISNRKGQGSDTFKLLIAAVVAIVILGIVTGVFQQIWDMLFNLGCPSNPINELVSAIQKSETGMKTQTSSMCMKAGEAFDSEALTTKLSNLNTITFTCSGAAVCKNNNPIDLSNPSRVSANAKVSFKGLVSCTKTEATGDYDCSVEIQSA